LADSGYYRLAVANADNINSYYCRAMSEIVHVNVLKAVVSGIISADTAICYNTAPVQLTSTAATGGSVALTYQWQQSADNGSTWANVIGGTGGTLSDYTPSALKQTTQYRLITTGGTSSCEADTSNVVAITVYDSLQGGSAGTSQSYCSGVAISALTLGANPATGGSGVYDYQWESSTDGQTWLSLLSVTTQTYALTGVTLPQTTFYRRSVIDSLCGTVYSDTVEITVKPLPAASVGMTELCTGVVSFLFPTTGGIWTSSDPSVAEIDGNTTVKGLKSGSATLTFTDATTGCIVDINVTVKDFPSVPDEIQGRSAVCLSDTVHLSNATFGGVWTTANYDPKVSIDDPNLNPVTVRAIKQGETYVTYTVSNSVCQTKKTFKVKVVPNVAPTVIIGVERK
jgi:hypothetical protein